MKRIAAIVLLLAGTVFAQTAGMTVDGKCLPAGAICKFSNPTPEWVPDPSAGHYDCPEGWMAYQKAEPPVMRDGPIAANMHAIYREIPKDKKGHLLGERPDPPICIQEPRP